MRIKIVPATAVVTVLIAINDIEVTVCVCIFEKNQIKDPHRFGYTRTCTSKLTFFSEPARSIGI